MDAHGCLKPSALYLHHRLENVRTLGPGVRYCLWVQGCRRRCTGCLAPETWQLEEGELHTVEVLANDILGASEIEGLTISGGEPFDQAYALAALITNLRQKRDLGVIVYTGYLLEELEHLSDGVNCFGELLLCTDLLIDGPYEWELNDGRSLRGSSNQRVLALTDRYQGYIESLYGVEGRKVELFSEGQVVSYAGIPPASFLEVLKNKRKG